MPTGLIGPEDPMFLGNVCLDLVCVSAAILSAILQKTIGVDESVAEDLILEPGQISLHDIFLVHGSEPNVSDRPRRGLTLRYFPTTSLYDREIAGQDYGSNVPDGGHGHTG